MNRAGMMVSSLFVVAATFVVVSVGCGDKKNEDKGGTTPEKTAPDKTTPDKTAPDKTAPDKTAPDKTAPDKGLLAKCQTSCLLLTEHKLSALVGDGFCNICGKVLPEACTAPNPFATDNCDQFDYQRNCVYAANGYKFKKKKWQDTFGKTDWYKVKDDFDEKDLTILETGNIRALRNRTSVCRGKALGAVSPKDVEIIKALFARKKSGKLKLPRTLYVDGNKATRESFLEFFNTEGLFTLDRHTPISYSEWGPGGDFDKKKFRNINVATGAPSPDCAKSSEGEDCEGFEWLDVLVDVDGNIVALGVGAAACPFVYAARGSEELVFAGEILRNRSRRSLETTQHVSLGRSVGADVSCGDTVRVRIAEEKRERTYLDDVALVVDGQRLAPVQCADPEVSFCADDGRYHVLEQGQSLDLRFAIPLEHRCKAISVQANGYYVPVP